MTDAAPSTVRCLRCDRVQSLPTDTNGHRCAGCGAFLPGNAARLRHGMNRYRHRDYTALPEDLRQSIEQFRNALISDHGGLPELSAVRAGLIRLLVGAETAFRLAGNELTRHGGISTPGGRLAFDRMLTASQTWTRIADKLGIDRRPKDATQDIREWWIANSQPVTADAPQDASE